MPSLTTHDIRSVPFSRELSLPAVTLGHSVSHDPDNLALTLPVVWSDGPGGAPLPTLEHGNAEDELVLELENLTESHFNAFLQLQEDAGDGATFSYSRLGVTSFGSTGWLLVSTDRDWTEVRHGCWSAIVHLARKRS